MPQLFDLVRRKLERLLHQHFWYCDEVPCPVQGQSSVLDVDDVEQQHCVHCLTIGGNVPFPKVLLEPHVLVLECGLGVVSVRAGEPGRRSNSGGVPVRSSSKEAGLWASPCVCQEEEREKCMCAVGTELWLKQ